MTERFAEAFGTDPLCELVVIERRIKVPPSELVLSKDGEAGWVAMNCGENCCLLFAKSANATERFVEKELDLGRYYDRERSRVTAGPIKSEFAPAFKVWAERWGVPIRETQGTIFQYTLSECPAECPKDFEIKPGMKGIIRDARLEDAEAIGRHWDHGCGASSSTTVRLLREIIMNGNPGTVIEIDGTPAAWGLQ